MIAAQTKKKGFPALSENSKLRYFTFIVLYFSQGIPEGITILGIPAWMAMNGKSATEIAGYSAVVLIPFSMKILLAPFMERYTFLPMGRRRPWLLFGQFGILCSLILLSFVPDPLNHISILMTAAVLVHVFIMFQDIATDSLVIDIVPLGQQGKANSLMWGSKTVGTSVSLALGSWLINQFGFSTAVLTMAASVCFIMLVPLLLKERNDEKLLPWTAGKTSPNAAFMVVDDWAKLFRSFKQVIFLKNSLVLMVITFITLASLHFMRTLLPIFTINELAWTNVFYSKIYSGFNLLGGIVGMLIGGLAIHRFGLVRMIQGTLLLTGLLGITLAGFSSMWKYTSFVGTGIALFCTLLTLIHIGVLALAMHLCWKRISAMQFTFYMSIFNLGLTSGAAFFGFLRIFCGWQVIFLVFSCMAFLVMVVLNFLKTNTHLEEVEYLERNYVEVLQKEGNLLVKVD